MKKLSALRNAMDALLNIYNFNFVEKESEEWPWKQIKKNILSFVNSIFDPEKSRCTYYINNKELNLVIDGISKQVNHSPVQVGEKEIKVLCELLDLLKQEADLNQIHFVVKSLEAQSEIKRDEEYPDDYFKSDSQILYEFIENHLRPLIKKADNKNLKLFEGLYSFLKINPINIDLLIPVIKKIAKHNGVSTGKTSNLFDKINHIKQYCYKRKNEANILNQMENLSQSTLKKSKVIEKKFRYSNLYARSYYLINVDPYTRFGKKLFYPSREKRSKDEFFEDNPSDEYDIDFFTVHSLLYDSWASFHDILKSFFVEYCFASDQFKNIKLCENRKCRRLIMEKRKNQKQFCSNKCRQAFFKQNPKSKCRDNQNKWIREQIDFLPEEKIKLLGKGVSNDAIKKDDKYSGKRILIEDCADCNEIVSRGHCAKIFLKNSELIDIEPKRKKKILKI